MVGLIDETAHVGQSIKRRFLRHAQIALCLRIFDQALLEFAQRFAGLHHDAQNLQRGDDAVTRGRIVPENHVAALFAADVEIAFDHLLDHVTVADLRAENLAADLRERFLQAVIAHHRGHQRILRETALPDELARGDGHDLVAVDQFALFVAKEDTVRVAVVGDADLRAGLAHKELDFLG